MNELPRKLIHLCGLVVPLLYLVLERDEVLLILGVIFLAVMMGEFLRFFFPSLNRLFLSIFSDVAREHEKEKILGASYFAASAFLVFLLFPRLIAVSCMLYLILGDSAAALVGTRFGNHRFGHKSIEGSLAFFCVSCLSSVAFIGPFLSLCGALTATITEAFSERDNLTIPLLSGAVLYGISFFFKI